MTCELTGTQKEFRDSLLKFVKAILTTGAGVTPTSGLVGEQVWQELLVKIPELGLDVNTDGMFDDGITVTVY